MKKTIQIAILLFAGLCAANSAQAQTTSTTAAPVQPANPALQGIVTGINSGAASPAATVLTGATAGALAGHQDQAGLSGPALGLQEKTAVGTVPPVAVEAK